MHDLSNRERRLRPQGRDVYPMVELMPEDDLRPGAASEGCLAGQEEVERAAQAVEVAPNVGPGAVQGQFRSHVLGSPGKAVLGSWLIGSGRRFGDLLEE